MYKEKPDVSYKKNLMHHADKTLSATSILYYCCKIAYFFVLMAK